MPLIAALSRVLAVLGRHGAAGFVVALALGLALPGLASTVRPLLPVSIFCFVTLTFARADFDGVRRALAAPGRLALATLWMVLAMPAMIWLLVELVGRDTIGPGLLLGMALIASGPPLMGFAAYAAMLGLDNSLALALLVITMVLTPLIGPPIASLVAGAAVPLDPMVLGMRLFWLLTGSIGAAVLLRRLVGPPRLVAVRHQLDGLVVLIYFIFAIAAMDGVIDATLDRPLRSLVYLLTATGLSVLGLVVAMVALRSFGSAQAFVLGLGTGMRNTGLLVVAMGVACPPDAYLFFSLLQFPIYCAPLAVAPLARRLRLS